MSMTQAEKAIARVNQAEANIQMLAGDERGLRGELVAAVAQVQATCAVAAALLAIADRLPQTATTPREEL